MTEDFLQRGDILCLAEIERGKGMSAYFMREGLVYAGYGSNLLEVAVHGLVGQELFKDRAFLSDADDVRHQHLEGVGDRHDNRFRFRVAEFDAVVGEGGRGELLQLEMFGITDVQTAEAQE